MLEPKKREEESKGRLAQHYNYQKIKNREAKAHLHSLALSVRQCISILLLLKFHVSTYVPAMLHSYNCISIVCGLFTQQTLLRFSCFIMRSDLFEQRPAHSAINH